MLAHTSTETDWSKRDDQGSPERFANLAESCLRVSESLETETVLQRVIDNARWLTGARYGVLLTYGASGELENTITSGSTAEEFHGVETPPQGKGLLGYLNEVQGPLRVADIASHPRSIGLPEGHPPMQTFLGMPIRRDGQHIGNIYLTETERGEEFTPDDEDIIVKFAAHAGTAISNARKFEAERRTKTDLRALVDISPIGVVVFDAKTGAVISANKECQRICDDLHLPEGSWERMPDVMSFRRADGREMSFNELPSTRVMQSGETVRAEEIVICLPNGRSVTTLVNAAPIYSERGEIVSVVVTVQDMTPRQDEERMRADFLGMVSQEMRTPLSAIKGTIAALTDAVSSMRSVEPLQLVQIIDHQADLMRGQINNLIDLTHIDAGTLQLSLDTADVETLITGAIKDFGRNHPGQTIEAQIPSGLPSIVADRQRVDQVLRDLLAHSFRYSAGDAAIAVSAELQDRQVAISVSTVGNPDHDTQPPQLFQRLRAARSAEEKDIAAVDGLALAIAKGIVDAHGGWFRTVRSPDERGVTFTLTIPTAGGEDATSIPNKKVEPGHLTASEKPRILVVAEDPHILGTIRRTLSRADFAPLAVFDLGDLDRLVAEQKPEVALVDLSKSGQKGFELLEWLVTSQRISVVGILDPGDEASAVLLFDKGADGYIVKPFSPTVLVARVKASIRRKALSYPAKRNDGYAVGDVSIDHEFHRVTVGGHAVQLTATEYKLLHELSNSAGRVMTQDELLHRVWGPEYTGESQLLRAYVKTLRQKLGDNARKPSYIFTEHGIGYRMAKP